MNVASPQWRGLSPEDLQLLSTIGDLLAIAVERARLFDRSARLGAVEERNRLAREIHDTLAQGLLPRDSSSNRPKPYSTTSPARSAPANRCAAPSR